MTQCFDHKKLIGGAAFPGIGEGLFLFTGNDSEVVGVSLPSIQFARFEQPVPSSNWFFEHNFGSMPLVQVYNLSGSVINEAVHVNVTSTAVTVSTEGGVLMAGFVTLLVAGVGEGGSGGGGSGGSGGSGGTESGQPVATNIDGGVF
jgi:hypothetical protein